MGVTTAPLRMDSQVKYGLLARGAASIFMRFPPPSYRSASACEIGLYVRRMQGVQ